jgi:hypothetical protein
MACTSLAGECILPYIPQPAGVTGRWRLRQSAIVYNNESRFSEPSAISGLALTKAFA